MNLTDIMPNDAIVTDGEYLGNDGLLHCRKCNEPLESILCILGTERKVRNTCSCQAKIYHDAEEARKKERIKRNKLKCFNGSNLINCTFEASEENEYITIAKKYVDNFEHFKKSGKGLILFGRVGTGKSHMAACIANALLDKGYTAYMSNFASIVNGLQANFDSRQEYIEKINNHSLLILDDLGAERQSEYMQENIFNIIDTRYKSGRPMIITSNLTSDELKKPSNIAYKRIYDRILEKCHPIEVTGNSFRMKNLKNDFEEDKKILGK